MADTPFDSIESAHHYVRLLAAEVESVRTDIQKDIEAAANEGATRRLDALQIVDYKLKQLAQQLGASSHLLNDLRLLRRLLVGERGGIATDPERDDIESPRL